MKLTISVDDEVGEKLKAQADLPRARTVEAEVTDRLRRFMDADRNKRLILLSNEQRQEIEQIVGATLDGPEDLIRRVKNMGCVRIGTVERVLSDGEMTRLKEQAQFQGMTVEAYSLMVINEAFDRFFDRF